MKNLPETLVELDKRRDNFVLMKYNSIRLRLIELYFIWTKLSLLLCNSTRVSGGFTTEFPKIIFLSDKWKMKDELSDLLLLSSSNI